MASLIRRSVAFLVVVLIAGGICEAQAQQKEVTAEKIEDARPSIQIPEQSGPEYREEIPEDEWDGGRMPVYEERPSGGENGHRFYRIDTESGETELVDPGTIPDVPEQSLQPGFEGVMSTDPADTSASNSAGKFSSYSQISTPFNSSHRHNVKILMNFPGDRSVCSGTLIDDEWVVTAGHCLHDDDTNNTIDSLRVVPAYEHTKPSFKDWDLSEISSSFGAASERSVYITQGWLNNGAWNHDIALIHLDRPVGVLTGWHGYDYKSSGSPYKNTTFRNKSYPAQGSYNGSKLYKTEGSWDFWPKTAIVNGTQSFKLCQNRVQQGGSSGSSAWNWNSGTKAVYAVVSHTKGSQNNRKPPTCYTRINQNKFNWIKNTINNNRPSSLDLAVLNVEGSPQKPAEGTRIDSLSFLVYNRSTDYKKDTWKADLYLSSDATISTTNDKHLGSYQFNAAISGQEKVKVNVPARSLPEVPTGKTGQQYIGVVLDVSDGETANNASNNWDALELGVRRSPEITIEAENTSDNPWIQVNPNDIHGDGSAQVSFKRTYPEGTEVQLEAPDFAGTNRFDYWKANAAQISSTTDVKHTVTGSVTLKAVYRVPDIPVKPHEIRISMPEHYTTSDKTEHVLIDNKHSTQLSWSGDIRNSSGWVTLDTESGTIPSGGAHRVDLTFSTDHLSRGTYTDYLDISSGESTSSVKLTLLVGRTTDTGPSEQEMIPCEAVFGSDAGFGRIAGGGVGGMGASIGTTDPETAGGGGGIGGPVIGQGMPGALDGIGGACMNTGGDSWGGGTFLSPSEGREGENFGNDIRVVDQEERAYALVGASGGLGESPGEEFPGLVYLFERTETSWEESYSFNPEGSAGGDEFGHAVASAQVPGSEGDEHLVAIGAPGADVSGVSDAGQVHVYRLILGDLVHETTLQASEGVAGGRFGEDVEVTSQSGLVRMAVGAPAGENSAAPGSVAIYQMADREWIQEHRLENPSGTRTAKFGASVAISGAEERPLVAVGAPNDSESGERTGRVYTYRYSWDSEGWQGETALDGGLDRPDAGIGESVQLMKTSNQTVLMAGAPGTDSEVFGGRALVFQLPDAAEEWQHRGTLQPEEWSDQDRSTANFGTAGVILSGNAELNYVVGAPSFDRETTEDGGGSFEFVLPDPIDLPEIDLETEELTVETVEHEVVEQTVTIHSAGQAELNWELEDLVPWIDVEDSTGTLKGGESETLTLSLDAGGLETGQYETTVTVLSNDNSQDSLSIAVSMSVSDKSEGDLVMTNLALGANDSLEAGSPLNEPIAVTTVNQGSDPIEGGTVFGLYVSVDSTISEEDSLIAAARLEAGIPASESETIRFQQGAFVPGEFSEQEAYLIVQADYSDGVPELDEENNLLSARVNVGSAPRAEFTPITSMDSLNVTLDGEDPVERQVQFSNTGEDTMSYSIPVFAENQSLAGVGQSAEQDSMLSYIDGVSPAVGDVAPGDTAVVTMGFSTEDTEAGEYSDTLGVITNDPERPTVLVSLDVTVQSATDVDDPRDLPDAYHLHQNYPNPFNPTTRISYELPEAARVQLDIYDALGRHVRELVDERKIPGVYNSVFDASDLASGVYFYHLQAGDYSRTRKMMMIR